MAKLPSNLRIRVEDADYNNYAFTCVCYDAAQGDATPDRTVTEAELMAHLGADSLGRIETVDNPGQDSERVRTVTMQDWLDEAGMNGLHATLEAIINKREGRTERAPFRAAPLPECSFLERSPIVHAVNAA